MTAKLFPRHTGYNDFGAGHVYRWEDTGYCLRADAHDDGEPTPQREEGDVFCAKCAAEEREVLASVPPCNGHGDARDPNGKYEWQHVACAGCVACRNLPRCKFCGKTARNGRLECLDCAREHDRFDRRREDDHNATTVALGYLLEDCASCGGAVKKSDAVDDGEGRVICGVCAMLDGGAK